MGKCCLRQHNKSRAYSSLLPNQPQTMRFIQPMPLPLNNNHCNSHHNNNREAGTTDNGNPQQTSTHNLGLGQSQPTSERAVTRSHYGYGNRPETDADPTVCINSGGAVSFTKSTVNANVAAVNGRDPDEGYRCSASANGNANGGDVLPIEDSRNVNLQQVCTN